MKKISKEVVLASLILFLIPLVSSLSVDIPSQTSYGNYSQINTNYSTESGNAQTLQGYTPSTLGTYLQGLMNWLTKAVADTYYAGIQWGYNQTYSGSTYNISYQGSLNNASYLSTYNASYYLTSNPSGYLTAESQDLQAVTDRGYSTTNPISVDNGACYSDGAGTWTSTIINTPNAIFPTSDNYIRIGDKPAGSASATDTGLFFNDNDGITRLNVGVMTEVNSKLLSFAINVPQVIATRNVTFPGSIFRLDTRMPGAHTFNVLSYPVGNATTFYTILSADLNSFKLSSYKNILDDGSGNQVINGNINTTANVFIGSANYISGNINGLQFYTNQTNSTGIAWFSGAISSTDVIDRTSSYDKSKGKALSWIKDTSSYLKIDAKGKQVINHSAFYGFTQYPVTDSDKPVIVKEDYEECHTDCSEAVKRGYNPDEETCDICETKQRDKIIYPYTKLEEGVSQSNETAMLRQAIFEIKDCTKNSADWKTYQECVAK